MQKAKLQEYCQKKKWKLPVYSTIKEGLDHCPQFKATVTVNGSSFCTPTASNSSKEAQNLVAKLAFDHLTGALPAPASSILPFTPTSSDAQQPKTNETLQAASLSKVNSTNKDGNNFKGSLGTSSILRFGPTSGDVQQTNTDETLQAASLSGPNSTNKDDMKFKGSLGTSSILQFGPTSTTRDDKKSKDMVRLCKNQLQTYAQKKNLDLPVYISDRAGPPHACRFKSKVMLEGKTYESQEYFSTLKEAENAAAKVALMAVLSDGVEEEDPGFSKNLLQELVQKEYSCLPAYYTTRSGASHMPIFVSTVEIQEESFKGQEAKTKKLAEMNAAKVAYSALKERSRIKDTLHSSPPNPEEISIVGFPQIILEPSLGTSEVPIEQARCDEGPYQNVSQSEPSIMVESEVGTNFVQNICGQKVDGSPFKKESLYSQSCPVQSPAKSGLDVNVEPLAVHAESSSSSSSCKKIKVYPRVPNMKFPPGTTVMHSDDKWIAVTTDSIHGNA